MPFDIRTNTYVCPDCGFRTTLEAIHNDLAPQQADGYHEDVGVEMSAIATVAGVDVPEPSLEQRTQAVVDDLIALYESCTDAQAAHVRQLVTDFRTWSETR